MLSLKAVSRYERYFYLLIILFLLNLTDTVTTLYGLSQGATELNPFYNTENLEGKILAPILFAFPWLFTYVYCDRRGHATVKTALKALLGTLLALYIFVVCNNLLQLVKA